MTSVLFLVTIPTADEEERLKLEFLAKKYDVKSDEAPSSKVGTSDKSTPSSGTPLKKVVTSPVVLCTLNPFASITTSDGGEKSDEGQTAKDNVDSMSTADIPSTAQTATANDTPNGSIQYGTFPKRRKSAKPQGTIRDDMEAFAAKSKNIGGSLKQVNASVTDGRRKSWEGLRDTLPTPGSKRRESKKKPQIVELNQNSYMEVVMQEILRKFQIHNAVWSKGDDGSTYQIFFTVEFNETYEKILDNLNEWGIGDREGSAVSVMNCIASKTFTEKENNDTENDDNADNLEQKQGAWERFMNSVRSRLNVAQIVRDVRQDASITFDFLVLLSSAAILAAFGLVEDSTIFLASSMLISPLMGPIIAAIFGTVIKDMSLGKLGLKNELIGILVAIAIGFVFGAIICCIDDRYSVGDGPTNEMMARCEMHSLIVGVFTAIPSGAAAAIGILGGNIGSLVGVAISASLLPPAVNSGLLWSFAVIYKFFEKDESRYASIVKSPKYSTNQATELAILGSISMCLTISNIICIYIMGILVLKVKEIAPVISRNNRDFWKHDIKIARGLNRNGFDSDNAIIDEFANLAKEDQKALGINYDFLRTINLDEAVYQNTWSPIGTRHTMETSYEPVRGNYSTVHPLDKLYTTITNQVSMREKRPRFNVTRRQTSRVSDYPTSYTLLSENQLPRCSTMPSKSAGPSINVVPPDTSGASTPTGLSDSRNRRKFIVTPAADDPLQRLYDPATQDA